MYGKIKTLAQAEAINESVRIMCYQNKSINDYISKGLKIGRKVGRKEGRQEGRIEGKVTTFFDNILKMNYKGFSAKDIANILDLDIEPVENIIAENNLKF